MSFANRLYNDVLDGRLDLDDAVGRMEERGDWERDVEQADNLIRASDRSRPEDAEQPSGRRTAPAVFAFQTEEVTVGTRHFPSMDCYNLTADVPGHPKGSTVTRRTLEALGYYVPARGEAA